MPPYYLHRFRNGTRRQTPFFPAPAPTPKHDDKDLLKSDARSHAHESAAWRLFCETRKGSFRRRNLDNRLL